MTSHERRKRCKEARQSPTETVWMVEVRRTSDLILRWQFSLIENGRTVDYDFKVFNVGSTGWAKRARKRLLRKRRPRSVTRRPL
jgi:hypothetical protein